MKIRDFLFAAVICDAGLASCSKDNDNNVDNPGAVIDEGNPMTISLAISQPKTYARDDDNATAAEAAFNTVDALIYKGNNLVKHVKLNGSDFTETANGENRYEIITPIETTTGAKEVYVGVNLPDVIRENITSTQVKGNFNTINKIGVADLTASSTGFAMFSTEGITKTLAEETDVLYSTNNTFVIPVERLVAKVTVQKDENLSLDVAGGTLSNLEFGIRNSNKVIFALQQKDGSGNIIDPNYLTSNYNASDFEHLITGFTAVDEASIKDAKLLSPKYAPENTSTNHWTRETTYASIRAKFIPEQFADENGDLYDNTNGAAVSFWTVTYNDGDMKYFEDKDDADTYAGTVNGTISAEYVSGYTYYTMFLNPNGRYNTIRNNYYKATIKSITGLGYPTDEDGGNTTEPVESPTKLIPIIDIVEWQLMDYSYDLTI